MEINSAKAKEIDSYIKDNKDCLQKNQLAVQLKGELKLLDVYKLPIEFLVYNKRNGRFAAEIMQKQNKIGRELDPLNQEDRKAIKELLLGEDENTTQLLKDNLIKIGQIDPGIMTFDGVVINGNRRMAVFEDLQESDPKYGYLTVARLPQHIDEKDIYRLEIDLQLSRPYRKDYGPINELLKIQEGTRIGLVSKQIANSLFGGYTEDDIKERLERLKLIDGYLEFIEKPNDYEEVKGWHEHFIDLQNCISTFKKKDMSAEDIHYATLAGFQLIIAKEPHMEVRRIKNLMTDIKTKEDLRKSVERTIEKTSAQEKIREESKESRDESKGAEHKKVPKKKKPKTLTNIAEEFKEDFADIVDTYKAHKESDKPKTLLKRALSSIESIDPKHTNMKDTEIIKLLNSIAEITAKLLETK